MRNIRTNERKTMEEILIQEYPGNSTPQLIERLLYSDGWRQDRDTSQPITTKQIRRGLRNNRRQQ